MLSDETCCGWRIGTKSQFSFEGGSLRPGSKCTFDFYSSRNAFKTGRFFSPKYPQPYPANTVCQYIFHAMREERVKITFQNIQLEVLEGSCANSRDRITVRDGHLQSARIIAQYCNTLNGETVWSSGQFLYIEMETDGQNQRQGFAAVFSFVFENQPQTEPIVPLNYQQRERDNPGDSPVAQVSGSEELSTTTVFGKKPGSRCEHRFLSNQRRSGFFSSPQFGAPFPSDLICKYIFQGEEKDRIQIIFVNLSFSETNKDAVSCDELDSVTVTAFVDNKPSDIGVYCDAKRPSMLMSSDNRLEVTFISRTSAVKGFKAQYNFLTDFGIKAGEPMPDIPCSFVFRSENTSNGTFTSPNFPGYYPRNTECHYLFYGRDHEKIYITFPYFDVDGIFPGCNEVGQSDYVELSNFNVDLVDRKMSRLCGMKEEGNRRRTVSSDSNFFRVTFRSNDVFDATGFEAFYQFRRVEGVPDRHIRTSMSSSCSVVHLSSRDHLAIHLISVFFGLMVYDQ